MKLGEIIAPELDMLLGKILKMPTETVSGKALVQVVRLAKKLADETKNFHEARIKICEELADKDEEGKAIMFEMPLPTDQVSNGTPAQKAYQLSDEANVKLGKKIQEMLDSEVKIGKYFDATDFDKTDLTGFDIMRLEPFIK